MRWSRRATPAAGWLLGVLALLVVLTQQGGQSHALIHELSAVRALSSLTADAALAGAVAGAAGKAQSAALAAAADDRDAADAVCVLCVGFANTLATALLPGPVALPLAAIGQARPTFLGALQQLLLRLGQPIRGPPAAFSIPW